jgi:hypothetical protein
MPRGRKVGRPKFDKPAAKGVKLSKNGKRLGRPPGSKTKPRIEQQIEPEKKLVMTKASPTVSRTTTTTNATAKVTTVTPTSSNVGIGVLKFVPSPESVLQIVAMELRMMADRLMKVNGVAVTVDESTTGAELVVETAKRVKQAIEYKPEEDKDDDTDDSWDEDDAETATEPELDDDKDDDKAAASDEDDEDDDIPDAAAKKVLDVEDDDDPDEPDDDDDDEDDDPVDADDDDDDTDDDDEEVDDDGEEEAGAAEEDHDEDDEAEEKVPAKAKDAKGAKDQRGKLSKVKK